MKIRSYCKQCKNITANKTGRSIVDIKDEGGEKVYNNK